MNISKEEIIEILKQEGMTYTTMKGDYRKVLHEHDFERVAEKILKRVSVAAEGDPPKDGD